MSKAATATATATTATVLSGAQTLRAADLAPLTPVESYDALRKGKTFIYDYCDSDAAAARPILVWLHGAGQNPHNEISARFAKALADLQQQQQEQQLPVFSRIYTVEHNIADKAVDELQSKFKQNTVFLGGHSQGAGRAGVIAAHKNVSTILMGCGVCGVKAPRYGMFVLGENDGDGKRYVPRGAASGPAVLVESENTLLVVPLHADHSLRIRDPKRPNDKDVAAFTQETKTATAFIAAQIARFVEIVLKKETIKK